MSKISRPSQKVTVFDPESGSREAFTTDVEEMARRAKKAATEAKEAKEKRSGK